MMVILMTTMQQQIFDNYFLQSVVITEEIYVLTTSLIFPFISTL